MSNSLLGLLKVLLVVLLTLLPELAGAQTITLTNFNTSVADSGEFFTDVWAKAKDFNDNCDVGNDNFVFYPESSANGVWAGNNPAKQAPAIGIAPIPTLNTALVYREDCIRQGLHYPIDAGKYTLLSYRMFYSTAAAFGILWSYDSNYALNGYYEHDYLPDLYTDEPGGRWLLKLISLPAKAAEHGAPAWSGNVTGLTLVPNSELPITSTTSIDWVRLVDPSNSPVVNLHWASASADANDRVGLYVDTNSSGSNGQDFAHNLPLSGDYSFTTGVLAPGTYYFYACIERYGYSLGSMQTIACSSHAGPLTVNGKPVLNFQAPGRMSGQEFAAAVRGDAWDMNEAGDIANFNLTPGANQAITRGFHDPVIESGHFRAVSDLDPAGAGVSVDTHIVLATPSGAAIDPALYRYFCYRMQIDTSSLPRSGDIVQLNARGLVPRFMYQNSANPVMFGSTRGHDVVEKSATFPDYQSGFTTYCLDLFDNSIFDTGVRWSDMDAVNVLRWDPVEAQPATGFAVDFAGLYQENRARATYTINWTATDPENSALTVSLYYDTDRSGFDGTQITTVSVPAGQGSYSWDVSGVRAGTYYLYAVVSDGVNTSRFYSEVPVEIWHLSNPGYNASKYALWNGFLSMINILELVNTDSNATTAHITFFDITGNFASQLEVPIAGKGQHDVILNELRGFRADSYGIVKIEYQQGKLDGRLSFYRSAAVGSYEYAFAVPLTSPLTGTSSVSFNTYQPSTNPYDANQTVAQWLSIVNLDTSATKSFTVQRYDAVGNSITSQGVSVPPFSRVDLEAGHVNPGAYNVGLHEIIPDDASAPYLAHLVRYGEKSGGGYAFAFPLLAYPGTSSAQWAPVSSGAGGDNWLEVVNAGDNGASVSVEIYDNFGERVWTEDMYLNGHEQRHIHASTRVTDGKSGAAKITAASGAKIIAQSMFYFRNIFGGIEAMYGSQARTADAGMKYGSYNLFLNMNNWLRVFNTTDQGQDIQVDVINAAGQLNRRILSLCAHCGRDLGLHETSEYGTAVDSYGAVNVLGEASVELLRLRPTSTGGIDFAMPTPVW